ncbi:hypothetical protein P3552_25935, partial [Vibrio parahaemolyticus]|nr:hypothetical protein [Vibrio parahaemolyticus]
MRVTNESRSVTFIVIFFRKLKRLLLTSIKNRCIFASGKLFLSRQNFCVQGGNVMSFFQLPNLSSDYDA